MTSETLRPADDVRRSELEAAEGKRPRCPVVIYTLVFPPDGVSTAQLYGELAEDLAAYGHDVVVVTTTPHYGVDPVASARQKLRSLFGGLVCRSEFRAIPVWHVRHPGGRRTIGKRIVGWSLFHVFGFLIAWRVSRRGSVVLVPSPLLTAGVIGALVARVRGGRMIYNVQELYPDLAIRTGRIRNTILQRILYRLERAVYDAASAVTAITPGMRRKIVAKGFRPEKVHFIPNFVDLSFLKSWPKVNEFSERHGLAKQFVVSYAGNIGFSQDLDLLVDAAETMKADPQSVVAFIGDGPSLPELKRNAAQRELPNVRFIEQQPYETVPQIYGASDLCVIPLRGEVEEDALPSKVLRIMACGRPILAICDEGSDLAAIVREAGAGFVVHERTGSAIAHAIRTAAGDRTTLAAMGESGRAYVSSRFAREAVTRDYSSLIDAVAPGGARA